MAGGEGQDLGALLGSLLSSPEVMGKLLSVLGGAGEGHGEATEVATASAEPRENGESESTPSSAAAHHGAGRRDGLLRALRPYLSPGRCKRLDGLMKISPMLGYLHTERSQK